MLLTVLMLPLLWATPQASPDGGRFAADSLWFRVSGTGPVVVLIHGADLDARSLAPLAAALRRDHQVVEIELRFHGRSGSGTGPFSFEGDVLSVLDAAGVGRATILGHSLGATVAIDLALARPDRVERLILMGPSYSGFPSQRPPEGMGPVIAALRRGQLDSAGRLLGRTPVMSLVRDTSRQRGVVEMVRANVRLLAADYSRVRPLGPPAAGRLRALRVPMLILVGGDDPTEAAVAADSLLAAVAGARLERIAHCGHLVPIDCPAEAIEGVRRFLGASAAPDPAPPVPPAPARHGREHDSVRPEDELAEPVHVGPAEDEWTDGELFIVGVPRDQADEERRRRGRECQNEPERGTPAGVARREEAEYAAQGEEDPHGHQHWRR